MKHDLSPLALPAGSSAVFSRIAARRRVVACLALGAMWLVTGTAMAQSNTLRVNKGFSPSPVAAGSPSQMTLTPSDQSTLSVTLVVLIPVFVSVGSVASVIGPLLNSVEGSSSRRATQALPKMKVAAVRDTARGGREVELVTLEGEAQGKALLSWPQMQEDQAGGFKVGEAIEFQPAQGGSGWLAHRDDGKALAFLPVANATRQVLSETW